MRRKERAMIEGVRDEIGDRAETVANEVRDLFWLLRMLVLATVAGAVYTELRKPPEQRTWHGKLFGVVPYDFRPPSLDQLRLAYWNPRSQRIFTERPLGVGWAVNIPTLLRRLGLMQSRRQQ
jgi:hypothetical protein